jgi:hypothetical protein
MKKILLIVFYIILKLFYVTNNRLECNKRFYTGAASNSFVCVCNSTYCDTLDEVDQNEKDLYFQQFVTSKLKYRLDKFKLEFQV